MPHYRAFGLDIEANVRIPGLVALPFAAKTDITVTHGPFDKHDSLSRLEVEAGTFSDRRVYRLANGSILIDFSDGTRFCVETGGMRIWTTWTLPCTVEDMATYLLGPILGYVMRLRGIVPLHASSFVTSLGAVALVGAAGAGKSTTAAAMARRGNVVLADDVSVLKEADAGFFVAPAYPRLRLWPESVEMLYGSRDALEPITPNWDKRDFRLDEERAFPDLPVPLSAILCLADRSLDDSAPRIETMSGQEKFVALVANTYGNRLLDRAMRKDEFEVLCRIVQTIPVRRLVPHVSPDRLQTMCDLISSVSSYAPPERETGE